MLRLDRKLGEKIKVGPVTFEILDIKRGVVKVGIDAPKDMHIDRVEIGGNKDARNTL